MRRQWVIYDTNRRILNDIASANNGQLMIPIGDIFQILNYMACADNRQLVIPIGDNLQILIIYGMRRQWAIGDFFYLAEEFRMAVISRDKYCLVEAYMCLFVTYQ